MKNGVSIKLKKNHPMSVYFTADERVLLARLAEHCCRSESEQVRWLIVDAYRRVFGSRQDGSPSKRRRAA